MIKRLYFILCLLVCACATAWGDDGESCTTLLKNRKWTKANNSIPGTGNLQGAAFLPASLNGIDGKDRVYIFKQVSGGASNSYSYYDVSTGEWTSKQGNQDSFTWAAVTHMGSVSFGPSVVSSYTGSDGKTYTCKIPFVYATGHTFLNASGNIVAQGTSGAQKYITCVAMDLENQRIVKVFAFPDRTDDCIIAYDFAGNRIWVIGYTQGKTGVSPYVIDEYRRINMTDFCSGNPTKWNYTDIARQTVVLNEDGGTNTPFTVPADGSPYCLSMQGGGPDDDGVQRTLENGTVQDCFYHDNHLYMVTGRGSLYNRTEQVKIHCFYVGETQHDYDKTIVVPLHQESQGLVYDSTNGNIYMTVTGGTETGLYKYATRAAGDNNYDSLNFQEAQEVSPATTPATYSITNGYELAWFLDQVYAGRTDINAELANNIDLTGITLPTSYYIYDKTGKFESQYAFRGTFDGKNHTISNLNIGSTPYDNDGLFPYIVDATIKDFTIQGNITLSAASHASDDATYAVKNVGLIGNAEGNCTVTGVNVSDLNITTSGVSSSTNVNGVIGNDQGDVTMSGVTGVEAYTITWYDSDGTTILKQTQVIKDREIKAPANPSKEGYIFQAWSPEFTTGTTATANATYTATYIENPYDNNGFKKTGTSSDADYYQPADLVNGWYEIDNAGKMWWFANSINDGSIDATSNAKVTEDINMDGTNHPNFPGIGYYASDTNTRKNFSGNFDGQGHRIYNCKFSTKTGATYGSGLIAYAKGSNKTIKDFTVEGEASYSVAYSGGAVGYLDGGYSISGITSSVNITTSGGKNGGVAGYVVGTSITKCRYNGTLTSSSVNIGGIVGETAVSMSDCLFDGTIVSTQTSNTGSGVGGLASTVRNVTISNCLVYGTIKVSKLTDYTGTVFAKTENYNSGTATLTNVYYKLTDESTSGITRAYNENGRSVTATNVTAITTQTWKDIKTALNNGRIPMVWGINSKEYPVPGEVDAAEYTVTFIANGGSECDAVTKAANSVITLPTPTKDGFVFTGWTVAEDGTGAKYAGGANYTITDDVTLYAQWTEAYTITFNTKGGSNCASATKAKNSVITLPTSTKSGYVFNSWNTAEDGSGDSYAAGASYTVTDNATLYAQWTETYTITFNSKGGSSCDAMSNVAGTQITLPTPTRDEYLFNGWNTDEDGNGESYAGGASYTITAAATLYAQWTLDETGDYRNGFHKDHAKTADDYYQTPTQITAERCAALGIDESYATDGYYEVKNAGNMFWISKNFSSIENNRKFVMTADINMDGDNHNDWAGIATTYSSNGSTHFQGVFDGLGHKFTNYYMKVTSGNYKSMFGVVTKATIKNFSIDGKVDIETDGAQYGVVVGRFNEGPNTIEDIHSNVAITVKDGKKPTSVGGVIGQCSSGGNMTTINRCRYSGTITGNSAFNGIGGILGNTEGKLTMTNCLFDGSISSTSTATKTKDADGIRIGGLAGGQTGQTLTVKNCLVAGTISVNESSEAVGDDSHSGIVFGDNSTTGALTISDTYYSTTGYTSGLKAVGLNNCTNKSLVVTASVTDAQIINGETCALLNANSGQWSQVLGYQVGANKTADSPVQANPLPMDLAKATAYPVSKDASGNYTIGYYFFDDNGDTTPMPTVADGKTVKAKKISYKREGKYMTNGFVSVCMPFALDETSLPGGSDCKVKVFDQVKEESDGNYVYFKDAENIEAGVPYFLYLPESMRGQQWSVELTSAEGIAITTSVSNPDDDTRGIYGSFNTIKTGAWSESAPMYKLKSNGIDMAKTTANSSCYPYRAYLKLPAITNPAKAYVLSFDDYADETSIHGISDTDEASVQRYNLMGQKVNRNAKGIIIVGGKKVLMK